MSDAIYPEYPDVPLSVALINSNLTLSQRGWALQAVTDRRILGNEIEALKKELKAAESEVEDWVLQFDQMHDERDQLEKELEIARGERNREILETRKELAPVINKLKKEAEGDRQWIDKVRGLLVTIRDRANSENDGFCQLCAMDALSALPEGPTE